MSQPDDEKKTSVEPPALQGSDIAGMLSSQGPIVKCVVLRAKSQSNPDDDNDKKPAALNSEQSCLVIDEISVDTTPQRNHVKQILQGPFTFLGQWPSEGTVVMARKDLNSLHVVEGEGEEDNNDNDDNNSSEPDWRCLLRGKSIKVLRQYCAALDIPTAGMLEKGDLVAALVQYHTAAPLNPHHTEAGKQGVAGDGASEPTTTTTTNGEPQQHARLQPPLHQLPPYLRGDILVMKVAETEEELDPDSDENDNDNNENDDADENDDAKGESNDDNKTTTNDNPEETTTTTTTAEDDDDDDKKLHVMSNDEFFLDYTKEEYQRFAARTDIPWEADEEEEEEEAEYHPGDEDDEDDDGDEEETNNNNDDDDDEDYQDEGLDKHGLMTILLSGVIQRFRQEHGRGPNTEEVLQLRSAVAGELDITLEEAPVVPTENDNDGTTTPKRPAADDDDGKSNKRVKFATDGQEETTDSAPVAKEEEAETEKLPATAAKDEGVANQNGVTASA